MLSVYKNVLTVDLEKTRVSGFVPVHKSAESKYHTGGRVAADRPNR
jgi:hypothetical protein